MRFAVRLRVKGYASAAVGHENRHWGVAAYLRMLLFPIERLRQERLLDYRRGLYVFGDEVHDRLSAKIHLAVLLASAENSLALKRGEPELVCPAVLTLKLETEAAVYLPYRGAQRMSQSAERDRAAGIFRVHERDTLGLRDAHPDRAARGSVAFLLPHGGGKRGLLRVPQERNAVKAKLDAVTRADIKHSVASMLKLISVYYIKLCTPPVSSNLLTA